MQEFTSDDHYEQIEDFLKDESFIAWVKQSDQVSWKHWNQWVQDHPEKQEVISRAILIVKGVDFVPKYLSEDEVDRHWQKFSSSRNKRLAENRRKSPFSLRRNWLKIAATVLILVVSMVGYNIYQHQEVDIVTSFGERKVIELADGTVVDLNANSTLSYVRNNPRKVTLDGEAYFTVSKKPDTGERFYVVTKDLDVEVLGTVFNVNSRDRKTEVVLQEGKVRLDMKEEGDLIMERGGLELVSYSMEEKKIIRKEEKVDTELHTSWKDGMLIFDNTPLSEVLKTIEDIYGVHVIFEESADPNKLLNGGVPSDDLDVFIQTLQAIYALDIEHAEDRLIIR